MSEAELEISPATEGEPALFGRSNREPWPLFVLGLLTFLLIIGGMWWARKDDAIRRTRDTAGTAYYVKLATYQVAAQYRNILQGKNKPYYAEMINKTAKSWAVLGSDPVDPVDRARYYLDAAACVLAAGDTLGARKYLATAQYVYPSGSKLYEEFAPLFAAQPATVSLSPKAEELLAKIAGGPILRARNYALAGQLEKALQELAVTSRISARLLNVSASLFGIIAIGFIIGLIWLFALWHRPTPEDDTPPWGPGMAMLVLSLHLLLWTFLSINVRLFINPANDIIMNHAVNVIATLTSAALVLGLFLLILGYRPWQWWVFGWRFSWRSIGYGILTWVVVMPLVVVATFVSDRLLNGQVNTHPLLTGLRGTTDIIYQLFLLAVASIMAPLVEETFFRGILFRAWDARFGLWPAAIITGVFFAAVHVSLSALLPIAVLGIAMALVTHYTRGIWASAVTHSIFNAYTTLATLSVIWAIGGK